MQFLIDSDYLIDFLADRENARSIVQELLAEGLGASVISIMEVLEGVMYGRDPITARQEYEAMMSAIARIPVDEETAEIAAEIRGELRESRRSMHHRALDVVVAATAIRHGVPLVTRNLKHFGDISPLRLWTGDISSN